MVCSFPHSPSSIGPRWTYKARLTFLPTRTHSVTGKNDFKESMWYHTLTKQVKLGIACSIYLALILGSRSMRISSVRPAWVDLAFKQMHRRIQLMARYNWLRHVCLLVFTQHKYGVIRSELSLFIYLFLLIKKKQCLSTSLPFLSFLPPSLSFSLFLHSSLALFFTLFLRTPLLSEIILQ